MNICLLFLILRAILLLKTNSIQRRKFIKTAALSAVAVSATGFIRFDGNRYVSDCETTSDTRPLLPAGQPTKEKPGNKWS